MKPASHGGGRAAAPAARGVTRGKKWLGGVWAPVLLKALGIVLGMLGLAAIGASSLARGSGVPAAVPSAHARAGVLAAGATAPAAADAGALDGDAGTDGGEAEPNPGLTADGRVVLNQAGATELRRIPGIGQKRAAAILALREKLGGRFRRVSDLLRVKGIGLKSLKKMEPHVVLDAPKSGDAGA